MSRVLPSGDQARCSTGPISIRANSFMAFAFAVEITGKLGVEIMTGGCVGALVNVGRKVGITGDLLMVCEPVIGNAVIVLVTCSGVEFLIWESKVVQPAINRIQVKMKFIIRCRFSIMEGLF
jgi:hypothetical protein